MNGYLTMSWNCYADPSTNSIYMNPGYLAWATDPFGGRNNWNRREHYGFVVAATAHEIGHLLNPEITGKAGEHCADRVAMDVVAAMRIDHEPF